ncbi:reverse transcriptase domain-containing protein, partial [Tanacetum coccineum]
RKPLEFKVGDRVLLKVSPWKGVVRFGKKGKLAPRYVGPFEIVECVGPVAYRLRLPQELSCIHDTFHVSNLKKCLAESDVQVPLEEIEIDENLRFVEEPIEIVERDVKKLKRRRIPLVKVRWNSRQGAEYTWEREDQFKTKCTPYKLVYGKAFHLPIELEHKAYWALKYCNFDLKTVGDHRKVQLNELNELRDQAYENSLIYKLKTKKIHDSKVKNRVFNVGDRVLLFNSGLMIFSCKLKTRWTGPFTVAQVFPYATIELSQTDGPNFKVNGHRLKHYFGGDIPPMVVPDLQTFPMDH